jgi:hypothetical protein
LKKLVNIEELIKSVVSDSKVIIDEKEISINLGLRLSKENQIYVTKRGLNKYLQT